MKQLLIFTTLFLFLLKAQSQNVGIGTATPATILDVVSTSKGVLFPRLRTAQMNAIVSPANGLIITNTDSANRLFIYTGAGWKGLSFTNEGVITDTSLLVHKTGNETINGNKIFTKDLLVNGIVVGKGGGNISTNTAMGQSVFLNNTTGLFNSAIGVNALTLNASGSFNTTSGGESLYSNITGSNNTGNGVYALYYNATGNNNISIGYESANYLADGATPLNKSDNSIFIGAETKSLSDNQTNQIVIGYNTTGLGSNTAVLGNDAIVTTSLKGQVGVNNSNPATSAQLDISSTTKGVLLPRMTKVQRDAIVSAATGLLIFQTDNTPGLRVFNGTKWMKFTETED